jgi:hypothetical protein
LITRITFGEDYRSHSSSLCSLLHSLVTSSFLGATVFLRIPLSNTLSVRDKLSHPCKTTCKIVVRVSLIVIQSNLY